MPHLYLSAAHKSSGKTTITLGLCAALRRRGWTVQPFKKGPDYIDPIWLGLAAGRVCRNLDFHTMEPAEIDALFARHATAADISLIEGNKGLHDGVAPDGSNSNAAMAKRLKAPVVLVIDTRGVTRGIAPLILGYQAFDPDVLIWGLILNQVGGPRHEAKLRGAIEAYTNIPVLGAVQRDRSHEILERHLGLVPANELSEAQRLIDRVADAVEAQVDVEAVIDAAMDSGKPEAPVATPTSRVVSKPDIRIGIARDSAFGFYYPDDLEAFHAAGAEPVFFDTVRDGVLPPVDGLFIGGGFPETQMLALEANRSLRGEIREAIDGGLPVYAECGGLMYLTRSIEWAGKRCEMVGALPADTRMHERPQGRGYVVLRETHKCPWPAGDGGVYAPAINAHEFHHSSLEDCAPGVEYAFDVLRGHGVDGRHDGIIYKNVVAGFSHQRDVVANRWVARFVDFARRRR